MCNSDKLWCGSWNFFFLLYGVFQDSFDQHYYLAKILFLYNKPLAKIIDLYGSDIANESVQCEVGQSKCLW